MDLYEQNPFMICIIKDTLKWAQFSTYLTCGKSNLAHVQDRFETANPAHVHVYNILEMPYILKFCPSWPGTVCNTIIMVHVHTCILVT